MIFPGGALPLQIFETRYLDMVKECVRNESGFGIVLLRSGNEQVYKTGTLCSISDWETLPNGLFGITARGENRIHIDATHVESNQLLVGQIEKVWENSDLALPEEFDSMQLLLRRIISKIGEPYSSIPAHYERAGWVGARLTELLPLRLSIKQRLLEIDDYIVRLHHLKEAMQKYKLL